VFTRDEASRFVPRGDGDPRSDVDHRTLNTDVPWLKGRVPTAENLALAFWERLRAELPGGLLRTVRVWETDKNWAEINDQA
jgi:6-pyruvoyltetrahydropterin/6-carboxytetrahydropterin synthase